MTFSFALDHRVKNSLFFITVVSILGDYEQFSAPLLHKSNIFWHGGVMFCAIDKESYEGFAVMQKNQAKL